MKLLIYAYSMGGRVREVCGRGRLWGFVFNTQFMKYISSNVLSWVGGGEGFARGY